MKASDPGGATMTIGELADRFGLATHVLRHWEASGLLSPARHAGQRRYGPGDLRRVAMILIGKDAGLGLRALREVLSSANPLEHRDLLQGHIATLEHRIAQAQAAKALIEAALDCPLGFEECPHAQHEIALRIPPATPPGA